METDLCKTMNFKIIYMNFRLQKNKSGSCNESSCTGQCMRQMYMRAWLHATDFLRTSQQNYITFVLRYSAKDQRDANSLERQFLELTTITPDQQLKFGLWWEQNWSKLMLLLQTDTANAASNWSKLSPLRFTQKLFWNTGMNTVCSVRTKNATWAEEFAQKNTNEQAYSYRHDANLSLPVREFHALRHQYNKRAHYSLFRHPPPCTHTHKALTSVQLVYCKLSENMWICSIRNRHSWHFQTHMSTL